MIDRLLVGLLTGGHVLIEGVPGLAKTLTVRSLAETMDARSSASSSRRTCCRRMSSAP
jgi:MoxR-like ATPase